MEYNALNIVQSINTNEMSGFIDKINQFQKLVQSQLKQNHDYGIIPGTKKPSLLKPGAEKINMLMGLTSNFDIIESKRDFENGFFQYQVKCILMKNGMVITEGLGTCNTREPKYIKLDPYGVDNTVLKMAKKRAFVDATLLVGSLSDIFSQDMDDEDLQGGKTSQEKVYTDNDGTISQAQAKRMFALAKGKEEHVKQALKDNGYKDNAKSTDVRKLDYEKVCKRIEELATEAKEGE